MPAFFPSLNLLFVFLISVDNPSLSLPVGIMASGLDDVKEALKVITLGQTKLLSAVEAVSRRVGELEKSQEETSRRPDSSGNGSLKTTAPTPLTGGFAPPPSAVLPAEAGTQPAPVSPAAPSTRVVLTTYPNQIGITPFPLECGAAHPVQPGPLTVSRVPSTIG